MRRSACLDTACSKIKGANSGASHPQGVCRIRKAAEPPTAALTTPPPTRCAASVFTCRGRRPRRPEPRRSGFFNRADRHTTPLTSSLLPLTSRRCRRRGEGTPPYAAYEAVCGDTIVPARALDERPYGVGRKAVHKKQRRQRWLQPPFFAGKLRDAPAGRRAGKTRAHVGRKCAGGGEERTQSRSSDFRIVGACAAFSVSQWRTFVPARGLRDHSGGTVRVLHPIPYSPPYPKRARRHFEPVFYFHTYSIATAMRNVKGMQNGSNDFSIQKYGILLTFRKTAGIMRLENQISARRDRVAATAEQQAARQARW